VCVFSFRSPKLKPPRGSLTDPPSPWFDSQGPWLAMTPGFTPMEMPERAASLLCSLLVLVLCLLKGLHKLWQHRQQIAAALRKLPQNCSRLKRRCGPEMLRSEVSKLQLDFARPYLGIMAAFMCISVLSAQARMRWGPEQNLELRFVASNVSIWNRIVLALLIAVALWVPCALTVRTLDLWNFIFNLHVLVFLSPSSMPIFAVFEARLFGLLIIQLPCMIYVQNMLVALFGYLCVALCVILRSLTADPETSANTLLGHTHAVVAAEVVLFPAIFALVSVVHKMFQKKVEARIRESDATSQLDAASALLRLTCDAVIELDSELRLMDHCPRLAGLLLRGASLQGVRFTDLISRAEAARAEDLLGNAHIDSTCSFANAFHTHLVDSCASKFRTEVFQVKYQMSNNEVRHLIGLRDFTDVKSLSGCKATDSMSDAVQDKFGPYTEFDTQNGGPSSIAYLESPRDSSRSSHQSQSSYAMIESEAEWTADKRDIPEHGVVEQVIELKRKNIILELDMRAMLVSAACAPVTALVGRPLQDVFMNDYTVDLCHRLLAHARQLPFIPDTAVSFEHMPIFCAPRVIEATGTMHVLQTGSAGLRVILIFWSVVDRIRL
ncbi:unnamed protein product, partial [Effrenium voratum]